MKRNIDKNTLIVNIDDKNNLSGLSVSSFPFKSILSLKYLVEYWKEIRDNGDPLMNDYATRVYEEIKDNPLFNEPITDISELREELKQMKAVMAAIYPPSLIERQIRASVAPFKFQPVSTFYSTPSYDEIFGSVDNAKLPRVDMDFKSMLFSKIIFAYTLILKKFYDRDIRFDYPLIFKVRDSESGMMKYYKISMDARFLYIKANKKIKKLSDEEYALLRKDISNISLWMEKIPPENFEFHGFINLTAHDVTEGELLSALKNDLLHEEAIMSREKSMEHLTEKIRSLFETTDIDLGISAYPGDWEMSFEYNKRIGNSLVLRGDTQAGLKELGNSFYQKAIDLEKPVIVEDLEKEPDKTNIEKWLISKGYKSILIAPLYYNGSIMGFLELASRTPGGLNSLHTIRLIDIIALFSVALRRGLVELNNRLQAIIKEKFTAIHPSVEWKFRRLAMDVVTGKRKDDDLSAFEDIIFDNVYPLYGMSDIRDSSENRNNAIKADLIEHLKIAKVVFEEAAKVKPLHVIEEMVFRIDSNIEKINKGLRSGDELIISEFIKSEVEPVFEHLKDVHPKVKKVIEDYFASLDKDKGNYYAKRNEFEESVNKINDVISNYIDNAQIEAQAMYPHYFEKYKSDGIEYGIYIGEEIVEHKKFDEIYLRNLRLWQLMLMCGIAQKTEKIKKNLPIPLSVTHLILIQNSPLSIKFRPDEKKFDVDGTYNARYEIMKKRIDKAIIKKSGERLTQPAKIAIIYSRRQEALEYKKYLEYLQSKGYINKKIEDLELDDLQGVQGLRALRIDVNMKSDDAQEPIRFDEYRSNGEEKKEKDYLEI